MKRMTLVVMICLLSSVSVIADELTDLKVLAEQGDVHAQNRLGIMHANGVGVPQDYAQAVRWFRKAAEQGHPMAQLELGFCYNTGMGVPQDYAEAVKWFRKAAEQGDAIAQYNLALMYAMGEGVPQNYVESYVWNSLAASSGDENAIEFRNFVAKEVSPEDLGAAKKRAAKLLKEIQPRK